MILKNDEWIEYLNSLSSKECELILGLILDFMMEKSKQKEYRHTLSSDNRVNWSIYHKKPANQMVKVIMMAFWDAKYHAKSINKSESEVEKILKR